MIPELYSIICDTYKTMNRTFDVPLEIISADSQLEDLGIDNDSFNVILMNIEIGRASCRERVSPRV